MKQFEEMKKLPFNLQFFADDEGGSGDAGDEGGSGQEGGDKKDSDKVDDKGSKDNQKDDKNKSEDVEFTPDQQKKMNEIIQKRVADEQKKADEKAKEAEKLAKMNAQQKQEYELEKANKKAEELEARINRYEMSKEASKMLSEKDIKVTDDLLEVVTKGTADETKAMVESFLNVVDSEVQKQVNEKLKGSTPRTGTKEVNAQDKESWEVFL